MLLVDMRGGAERDLSQWNCFRTVLDTKRPEGNRNRSAIVIPVAESFPLTGLCAAL